MYAILLIAVIPALVMATVLYAALTEARHNSTRSTRWERDQHVRESRRLERIGGVDQ